MTDPFTDKPAGGLDIDDDLMDELFSDDRAPDPTIAIRLENPDPGRLLGNWKHLERPNNGHARSPRRQR